MYAMTKSRQGEKGFTLVELAIVMIIIGLLIGGILKGQELVGNARLTSAVTKIKSIDAALSTFRDTYQGLPGDILSPSTRLPNCVNRCNTAGNGNGRLTEAPGAALAATSENQVFWAQLATADLLGGVRDTPAADNVSAGGTNPSAEVSGQFVVGYTTGGSLTAATGGATVGRAGHYLLIHNAVPATAGTATVVASGTSTGTASLTPNQASRIDSKVDDGRPNTGSALAMGTATCAAATTADEYITATTDTVCGIYIRIQQ